MRIIKKKKGKNTYFYLQHSIRKGNKVITREKYLGTTIPKDLEIIKKELEKEYKKDLYKKLEKIRENFQEEWKKYPKTVQEKEKEEIAIAFIYNTNAIEGSTITLEETRDITKEGIAPNKPLRDIKETENHYKIFLNMLNEKEVISNSLLLKWHMEIFGSTKSDIAGKYRDYSVRVGNYRAPDWQDVEKLMNQFVKFLKESKINSVELAARAHYKFERIHPFGDGNGRIGRLIINHILWWNGCPMIIIEYQRRISYYKALNKDEEGFVKYFLRRYLAIHKRRINSRIN
ncbi:Fic family protein [Candidatus Woesearchaeota archaeon]|nr:Fic family protein [Candidatus Woesearchaeota archaeon]